MILLFILGVLLALISVPMLVKGSMVIDEGTSDQLTIPLRFIGFVLLGIAGVFVLLGSLYTQDTGEVILIKSAGGDIIRTDTNAGFGLTAPWNKRISFDVRNQRIEMFTNAGGDGNDGAAISAPLKNGSNVDVSITVQLDIRPECVDSIYREYRSQDRLWDNVLKPNLRDQVRQETAKFDAFEIKQRRAELATSIQEGLDARWSTDKLCISLNNVDLGDLRLDQRTEDALQAVNERQTQVEAARADLERARVEAEVTKTEAKAQTDADQIVRCGADVRTETQEVAGQETEVVIVTPKTGAACENRLNEQVLLNNWIDAVRAIGEKGNTIVIPENLGAILNMNSVPTG